MAELDIFEKYPNSWRADHPDFADVYKTTFSKGTITDFKVTQDDPFEVESMVKVEVEGKEFEDYIPIFYHPKEHYWDHWDPDAEEGEETQLATEFNEDEEKQYFEKAWMSFRGGDEVVVMLKATEEDPELKPVAVMGFVDGVPRLGENVFKIQGKYLGYTEYFNDDYTEALVPPIILGEGDLTDNYYYAFKSMVPTNPAYEDYDAFALCGDELPEDFDKEKICVVPHKVIISLISEEVVQPNGWYYTWDYVEDFCCTELADPSNPDSCPCGETLHRNFWEQAAIFRNGQTIERFYAYDLYWVVGPLMFCFRYIISDTLFQGTVYLAKWTGFNSVSNCIPPTWYDGDGNLLTQPELNDDDPLNQHWQSREEVDHYGVYNLLCTPDPADPHHSIFTWPDEESSAPLTWWEFPPEETGVDFAQKYTEMKVYATIFTPELWENPDFSNMILQTKASDWVKWGWLWTEWLALYYHPSTIKMFVPPHSKEEMQAAGLWPKES